jgi:hypothetical protein
LVNDLQLMRGSLPTLAPQAIERAIESFVNEVDVKGDPVGFYTQTMNSVYAAVYRGTGDFWLAVDSDGKVAGYALGHVTTEIDNRLTYWLAQCWVSPSLRGTPLVKQWWQKMREQAKKYFCKHIVVVSGRGTDAYCRFLGEGWHEYAALLKEDI